MYTIINDEHILYRNPELDLGDGVKIMPAEKPKKIDRKRLEALI